MFSYMKRVRNTHERYTHILNKLRENLTNKLEEYKQNEPNYSNYEGFTKFSNYHEDMANFYVGNDLIIMHALRTARKIKKRVNKCGLEKIMRLVRLPFPKELDNFIGAYQHELNKSRKYYRQELSQKKRLNQL